MKHILTIIILVFSNYILLQAQTLDEITKRSIDDAILVLNDFTDFDNLNDVKLLGLGDVAELAMETKKLNTYFSAFLIQNKNYRTIFLSTDDWIIRPINNYLNNELPADSLKIDTLINTIFSNNHKFKNDEFKSLLYWIKKFNSSQVHDKVSIIGVTPYTKIPASYFLSNYIYPIDSSVGKSISEKWTNNETDDSTITSDILDWIEVVKTNNLSDAHRLLINRCEADILHNTYALKLESLDQKTPAKTLNIRSKYIANQILKNLNFKGIFLSSNTDVSISKYHSPIALDEIPINSIGGFLKKALENKYYVIGLDYTSNASLPFVNIDTQSLDLKIIPGNDKLKHIKSKRDYLTKETDHQLLMGYKLVYIYPFFTLNTATVIDKTILTVDALFLLSDLTTIELNN